MLDSMSPLKGLITQEGKLEMIQPKDNKRPANKNRLDKSECCELEIE